MSPNSQFVDEPRFIEVAVRDASREKSDGLRLAQVSLLEELVGAVFGTITLWYLVMSLAGLV